jgi:hypothetical protein
MAFVPGIKNIALETISLIDSTVTGQLSWTETAPWSIFLNINLNFSTIVNMKTSLID